MNRKSGGSSTVEYFLAKEGVAGSNPVHRSLESVSGNPELRILCPPKSALQHDERTALS